MSSTRKLFFFLLYILLTSVCGSGLISTAFAEGTRSWEQSKFDELTKGTATGVAIRSAGGLELAPTFKSLYATPSTYIWAIAADDSGNVYVAAGAPARVYRITPDGKASIIFEPKELQVQALQIAPGGAIYAATAPDGKVYKLEHNRGDKTLSRVGRLLRKTPRNPPPIPPGVHPSISNPARNIYGISRWISPATCTLPPATMGRYFASRQRVSTRYSSRATKLIFACWLSMRKAT